MRMISMSSAVLTALFIFPLRSSGYTYWVDESCSKRPEWDTAIKEAFTMARRAHDRLSSKTDTDFAAVFKRIFKADKNDKTEFRNSGLDDQQSKMEELGGVWTAPPSRTAFGHVNEILRSIANDWSLVRSEEDRLMSNIRFYCDEDSRFKARKNAHPDWMYDSVNGIKAQKALFEPPKKCSGNGIGGSDILAKTYSGRAKTPKTQQNVLRCTITICNFAFDRKDKMYILFQEVIDENEKAEPGKDFRFLELGVKASDTLLSGTILHEMTHFPGYALKDVGSHPYGFHNIMEMDSEDSTNNADSYTQLGLFALLADIRPNGVSSGGYTLPRLGESGTTDESKKIAEENEKLALKGQLALYKDLTKRWLNIVGKEFRS